jgi:glycosyltransferase involved in cell wall biosynthesis
MPAKVLFYTHGLVDGGAERLWSCLASAIKTRGFDVVFAQDFEADDNRANLDATIPVYTLGRSHWRSVLNLADVLRTEKPDIALAAVGGSNLKLLLAKSLARSNVRTIITYHGFREWTTGVLSFVSYFGLPILSTLADSTVAVSDGLREKLVNGWHARKDRTITILNPVFFPSSAEVPSAVEIKARPDTLLAVGRFVPEKDFTTLIRAFARLERPGAKLVILGKGPEEGKLRSEIARLGLKKRVLLPGYSKEPWSHYAGAKCFVLSSNSEPFGNVIVEALAYGLPVVSTACSGPQEILLHGRYGRIVAVGDELQLAHALKDALDEPGDPLDRRRRADEFSFDVRVPTYEALIRKILQEHGVIAEASAPAIRPAVVPNAGPAAREAV